ncbi:MAG: hypothetical protein RL417_1148 [Pseudomonadota bacterium]
MIGFIAFSSTMSFKNRFRDSAEKGTESFPTKRGDLAPLSVKWIRFPRAHRNVSTGFFFLSVEVINPLWFPFQLYVLSGAVA